MHLFQENPPADPVDPEILRLSNEIEADKNAIRDACLRLGKAYFEAHRHDPEDVMEDDVRLICSATEAIKANQAALLDRKGLMLCPECRGEIAKDAVFCNLCGFRLREPEPEPVPVPPAPVCRCCGAQLQDGQRFCTVCGTPVSVPDETLAPQEPRRCAACGTELSPDAKFCFNCGTKV